MPELTRYLGRLCRLLRQGEPTADIALYVPNDDLFATMGRSQGGSLDTWREARRRIPTAIPAAIRGVGLDYDLIDDDALGVTAPGRYRWSLSQPRPESRRRPRSGLIASYLRRHRDGRGLDVRSARCDGGSSRRAGRCAGVSHPSRSVDLAVDAGHRLRAPSLRRHRGLFRGQHGADHSYLQHRRADEPGEL